MIFYFAYIHIHSLLPVSHQPFTVRVSIALFFFSFFIHMILPICQR